jgi:hypothetical protein
MIHIVNHGHRNSRTHMEAQLNPRRLALALRIKVDSNNTTPGPKHRLA